MDKNGQEFTIITVGKTCISGHNSILPSFVYV